MASLSKDNKDRRRIQFYDENGVRKSIRLGKLSKRKADQIKVRVEHLILAKRTGFEMDLEVAEWLTKIDDVLARKLAAVGLITPRAKADASTLAKFIDNYIKGRANLKSNTLRNYLVTRNHLVGFFGADKRVSEISPGDADQWHENMAKSLSPATVSRETKRAKQFFRSAVRNKLIRENPFADLATPAQVNDTRGEFVSIETIEKVIDACPDTEWRLIVALARYGGVRTPSETLSLEIGDVDWANERLTIRSPKTAHHRGGDSRIIPLFPELKPCLEAAFDEAEPGQKYFITRYRDSRSNLRTHFLRIIKRAGIKPWPKLFHNLRASRQTELTGRFPIHVVCEWLGNSAAVADKHYLQVTDEDYRKASTEPIGPNRGALSGAPMVRNPAPQAAAKDDKPSQETKKARQSRATVLPDTSPCDDVQYNKAPPRGVEPLFSG